MVSSDTCRIRVELQFVEPKVLSLHKRVIFGAGSRVEAVQWNESDIGPWQK